MSEYDYEPIAGLPGHLPEGEHILWQGGPDWKLFFASALHVRLSALYFVLLGAIALVQGKMNSVMGIAISAVLLMLLFAGFAWAVARTTIYTLTNRRIVLRIGIALNSCINLPLSQIDAADLKQLRGTAGSIVLHLKGLPKLGYWLLWPHARSLRLLRPQPMLRAIPDAAGVAQTLLAATQKIQAVAPAAAKSPAKAPAPLIGAPA
jgi:Bacterial PH domain